MRFHILPSIATATRGHCSTLVPAFTLFAVALTAPCRASATEVGDQDVKRGPHRLMAAAGGGTSFVDTDIDGHYDQTGYSVGFGVGYAYDLGVELGARLDIFTESAEHRQIFLPTVTLRPYLTLSAKTELGLGLRAGGFWLFMKDVGDWSGRGTHDHVWSGISVGLNPDIRCWITPEFALEFGPEALLGGGNDTGSVQGSYLKEDSAFIYLGGVLKGTYAP